MSQERRENCDNALSLSEYCRVIDEAADHGIQSIEISGEGEPLLSSTLRGIIDYADNRDLITTLITNGHDLSSEFAQYCYDRKVTLVVSLFSLKSSVYEQDNNLPGSFSRTLDNIECSSNIYKSGVITKDNNVVYRMAIHTTCQADNMNELKTIREFCDLHDMFFSIAPLAPVGGGAIMHDQQLSQKQEDIVSRYAHNSIILSHTSETTVGREVCGTCLYGLNIGFDGNLLFDAHAGYEVDDRLGNIRRESISELVRRQKYLTPMLFRNIEGFCPMRDPRWPGFLSQFLELEQINFEHTPFSNSFLTKRARTTDNKGKHQTLRIP